MLSLPIMSESVPKTAGENKAILEATLCRRLLDLGRQSQLAPFLEEALRLIVEITGVQHGYLELYDESGEPQWSIASGFSKDELREVRQLISRGIISAAISSG